jgi:hypothetical protein
LEQYEGHVDEMRVIQRGTVPWAMRALEFRTTRSLPFPELRLW